MVGQWTTIEEWQKVDMLALNAWKKADVIGHEVKVSRSDYRTELMNPWKREWAVDRCTQFYFVTPKGLLKEDELRFEEPAWTTADFQRTTCPGRCMRFKKNKWDDRGKKTGYYQYNYDTGQSWCTVCDGKGWTARSRVEQTAPTLWVPKECGLIEVTDSRTYVVKKAPVNEHVLPLIGGRQQLNDLVRWVSNRPDPRHVKIPGEIL